jgi:hypothetical protein
VERLLGLDEKWVHYRIGSGLEPGSKPTNTAEGWYNLADEITVVVTLKSPGPGGRSFLDYAFENRDSGVILKRLTYLLALGSAQQMARFMR